MPVEVDAVRFTGDNWAEMHEFTGHVRPDGVTLVDAFREVIVARGGIVAEVWDRLHSTWIGVKAGHWVVRGTEGEYYACVDRGDGLAPLNYEPA